MKSSHLETVVLLLGLFGTSGAFGCTKSFDGAAFMKAAASRGLALMSPEKCQTAEMQNNNFFAPPGATCKFVMPNQQWLASGFSFQSIQGSGRFETELRSEGVLITVLAGAGMKFDAVTITAPPPTCDALLLNDVFIGAVHVSNPTTPKDASPPEDKPKVQTPAT